MKLEKNLMKRNDYSPDEAILFILRTTAVDTVCKSR